jgi:hypothetical protein
MKQRKRYPKGQSASQTLTRAVTHIRLDAANGGKLAVLDDLAQVYLPLCQQYLTLFCTEESPDKFRATCFATPLSERRHRVAIQQASGIAQSWRTNRANAYVVVLEPSHDSTFNYWLKISTLELREQLLVPVKLSVYHCPRIAQRVAKK